MGEVRPAADRAFDRRHAAAGRRGEIGDGSRRSCGRSSTPCCPACATRSRRRKRQRSRRKNWQLLDTPPEKRTTGTIGASLRSRKQSSTVTDREVAERIAQGRSRRKRSRRCNWPARSNAKTSSCNTRSTTSATATTTIGRPGPSSSRRPTRSPPAKPMFEASQRLPAGRSVRRPSKLYEEGFAKWRQVIDRVPEAIHDEIDDRRRLDRLHQAVSQRARSDGRAVGRRLPAVGRDRAIRQRAEAAGRARRPSSSASARRVSSAPTRPDKLRRRGRRRASNTGCRSAEASRACYRLVCVDSDRLR